MSAWATSYAFVWPASVSMIERTYSRHIGDHSDQLARGALLDTTAPAGANVVPMRASGVIE